LFLNCSKGDGWLSGRRHAGAAHQNHFTSRVSPNLMNMPRHRAFDRAAVAFSSLRPVAPLAAKRPRLVWISGSPFA